MMQVEVLVLGELLRYLSNVQENKGFPVELSTGANVEALLNHLGVPAGEIGVILINGKFHHPDAALNAGDQVLIMPQLEGG
jgi:sulfur carrier protein ThiS